MSAGRQTTTSVSVNLCCGTEQVLTSLGTGCVIEVGLYGGGLAQLVATLVGSTKLLYAGPG